MTKQRKPAWRYLVFLTVWAVLIGFVVRSVGRMPSHEDWASFAQRGALPGASIFAVCFLIALTMRAYRFGFLIRVLVSLNWRTIAYAFPWLFMLGAVTPFRLGDVARADWVRRRGGSAATTLGLWLAERATDSIILICLAATGTALAPVSVLQPAVLWGLLAVVGGGYLALWLANDQLQSALCLLPRIGATLAEVVGGFQYMKHSHLHFGIIALSVAIWGVMALGFWGATNLTLGLDLPLGAALLCVSTVNLAAIISAAPGNLGSFQAAFIASLALYGVSAADALMASAVLQGTGLTITLLMGAVSRLAMFTNQSRGSC